MIGVLSWVRIRVIKQAFRGNSMFESYKTCAEEDKRLSAFCLIFSIIAGIVGGLLLINWALNGVLFDVI